MEIEEILAECRDRNIVLEEDHGRLRYEAPAAAMTAELRMLLKEHRNALVKHLQIERERGFTAEGISAESELGKTKGFSSTPPKAVGGNSLFCSFLEDIRSGGFYSGHFPQVADYLHRVLPAEEFGALVKEYEAQSGQTLKLDDVSDAGKSPQPATLQAEESARKDPEIRCIDCQQFQGGPTPHSFGLCQRPANTGKRGQWGMARHRCKEFVACN